MKISFELNLDLETTDIGVFVTELISLCDRYLKNPQLILTKGQREFLTELRKSAVEAGDAHLNLLHRTVEQNFPASAMTEVTNSD